MDGPARYHQLRCLALPPIQSESPPGCRPLIEDLLAERGITVSREAIRLWCLKFGALYARRLKQKHHGYGDTFFIDEVFVKINGRQHYLWRVVDQDGEVVDVYLQAKRDGDARFKSIVQAQRFVTAHAAGWWPEI